jgi:membrane-associated protease RseP (regulator of RpoE activity)
MKMENLLAKISVAALIIISILLIYCLYFASSINVLIRAASAIIVLLVSGIIIAKLMDLKGGYGFYMLGSKAGLSTISSISKKYRVFWDLMAVWGLTLGFGILTYPLLKGKIDKRVYAFGILSLIVIIFFVLPYLANAFQFINIPQIQNAISARQASGNTLETSIMSYATTGITIFSGFTGTIVFSLFTNTESILYSIVRYITMPSLGAVGSGISSQIPGVAPVIPGIDIPLFAGIISLIILLIIHEFSHGILAKAAKVKLKSIGLLVFGFIPVGGYVEPDEKMVEKLDSIKQTKIFSAGIAANFIAMLVFFALMVLLLAFVIPNAYQYKVVVTGTVSGYPANGILESGMQVLKWNNSTISNISDLDAAGAKDRPNQTIGILTDKGLYKIKAVADPTNSSRGVIGVSLGYLPILNTPYGKLVYFLYTVFGLSMLLNFLVAVVNLLPIPGFDGWRIYRTNIKNQKFVNFLGALIIIFLILNVLPWLFYL